MRTPRESHPTQATRIAQSVSQLSFDALPEQLVRIAERAVTDTVGVALAGVQTPIGQKIQNYAVTASGTGGDTLLLGRDMTATQINSVLANCTVAHALDFDDDSLVTHNHPSAVLVPTLLSCATAESTTGRELITAYVAGLETQYHLAHSFDLESHVETGWHATATLGTFGAVTATAHQLNLSSAEIATALNIASSMPAGLTQNFGTMTKPLHAGLAARSGLMATLLAAQGVTADSTAVDEFGSLYMQGPKNTKPALDIENDWLALADSTYHLKKYPCCGNSHTAVAGTLELAREHDITPDEVEAITVTAPKYTRSSLPYANPGSGLQAKFSMEYTVAKALVEDGLDLGDFSDTALDDPTVEAIRQCVAYETSSAVSFGNYDTTVEIQLHDGTTHRIKRQDPPGTHTNPLTETELQSKFMTCATKIIDASGAERAFEELLNLRELSDASEIWQQIT